MPAAPASIAGLWSQARRLDEQLKASYPDDPDDPEAQRELDRLFTLEDAVLAGPIHTPTDCMAKLAAAGISLDRGMRCDGADQAAYAEAILWMGGQ